MLPTLVRCRSNRRTAASRQRFRPGIDHQHAHPPCATLANDEIRKCRIAEVDEYLLQRSNQRRMKLSAGDVEQERVGPFVQLDRQHGLTRLIGVAGPRLAVDVDHRLALGFQQHDLVTGPVDLGVGIAAAQRGVAEPTIGFGRGLAPLDGIAFGARHHATYRGSVPVSPGSAA